jgi:hypothetical protein
MASHGYVPGCVYLRVQGSVRALGHLDEDSPAVRQGHRHFRPVQIAEERLHFDRLAANVQRAYPKDAFDAPRRRHGAAGDAADQVTAPVWKIYPATSHAKQHITNSRHCGNLPWQSSLVNFGDYMTISMKPLP